MLSTSMLSLLGRSAKPRIFPAYPQLLHFLRYSSSSLFLGTSSSECAANNFLKLTTMKKQTKNTEKSLWQEFTEYLATIYWPEAENELPVETINWEYKAFKQIMAH